MSFSRTTTCIGTISFCSFRISPFPENEDAVKMSPISYCCCGRAQIGKSYTYASTKLFVSRITSVEGMLEL